jgi:cysteinyl-tRNA synthetase
LGLLGTHYRHPLDFGPERIDEATRAIERFRTLFEGVSALAPGGGPDEVPDAVVRVVADADRRFREAMDDDFNAPQALAALFELARALHAIRGEAGVAAVTAGVAALRRLGQVLGLFMEPGPGGPPPALRGEIERLLDLRTEARRRRAWAEADALRVRLASLGVTVEDASAGTSWTWRPGRAIR